jgi:hypothetical protein
VGVRELFVHDGGVRQGGARAGAARAGEGGRIGLMTRALPFTEASMARAIKGVKRAGLHVVAVRPADGTLIVADKPVDVASLVPADEDNTPASKWEED